MEKHNQGSCPTLGRIVGIDILWNEFRGRRVDKDWIVILTAVIAAARVYAIRKGDAKSTLRQLTVSRCSHTVS